MNDEVYKQVSKIQDSLLIFMTIGDAIESYYKILESERKDKNSIVYAAISSHIQLMGCAFKAEWNRFSKLENERNRIEKVGIISKPFRKRINQWSDLELVRNVFLAHNFRDQNDNYNNRLLKPFDRELKSLGQFQDYTILYRCIIHINLIILKEFLNEWNDLIPKLKGLKQLEFKVEEASHKDALKTLKDLIEESNTIAKGFL